MDARSGAAKFYDLNPNLPKDVPFYGELLPGRQSHVLELGCGTGRVLIPLSALCGYIHGVDVSQAMVSLCRNKLSALAIPSARAHVEVGDISGFSVGKRFDLVIAPFRVLQNLETDGQVHGLFRCIRTHLAQGGTCVLNVFNPFADADMLRRTWVSEEEKGEWEIPFGDGKLVCSSVHARMDREKMILYPEMVYRHRRQDVVKEEVRMSFVMRCYYPDQFRSLIEAHGFRILEEWGGYEGQPYGKGPELVIQFEEGS
jgi:SAM-dependent methyltransferase